MTSQLVHPKMSKKDPSGLIHRSKMSLLNSSSTIKAFLIRKDV